MNRINLITLGVKDLKASLQFYKNIGFKTTNKETDDNLAIVFFNNSGTKLELFPINELAKDINPENPPTIATGGFIGITLAYNAKSKSEVDDILGNVERFGATIVKPAQALDWGGYGGYFTDLDGYYWEVAFGDMWEFDNQNMLVIPE
ncbi:VOC family protein [Staphylococcus caeli]|uniref:Member of glyoxalase/bleomycin resistance protein family n=1 Tax=Staphylococcus caeli TaxID=2201815 RepID=A0A1D4LNX2_9STAP|nr:VOC family protein [Staphylococcus caeli]SCS64880.1 putative member of glyoxalase/bleomycin resistance protein family [Staphylococcus caeli]SCS87803.1 putative member of glyoxalase/bleomycin resistance protein family [Staphylococcus caeli]